ncbi:MAG: MBL fold metallo-hydrolase [Taibaiella sp.]|nr:MBL fold metallo-hydrolase [Taibaiella sp.]
MKEQLDNKKEINTLYFNVAADVWGTKDIFVNMYMIRNPADNTWVMVDTGLKSSVTKIKKMAATLFGPDAKPAAIILTHGHFDHTGSLCKLLEEWNVPVYAHYLEIPYLTGRSSYPPADPSVGGGLMSSISWVYPKKPINIEDHLQILPPDGSVPHLPEWQYLYTPGHSPGHISLYRSKDKVLIAGDAFVTTNQESVLSVMTQAKKISGPPKYFTYDWEAAGNSVKHLAALEPNVVATGHGKPLSGDNMRIALTNLAVHFDEEAVPKQGRYVNDPAVVDATGIMYLPEKEKRPSLFLLVVGVSVVAASIAFLLLRNNKKQSG